MVIVSKFFVAKSKRLFVYLASNCSLLRVLQRARQVLAADMLSKSMGGADKGKYMQEMMAGLSMNDNNLPALGPYGRSNSVSSSRGRAAALANYAPSFMAPITTPFYPPGETVESVIGTYLVCQRLIDQGELAVTFGRSEWS